MEKARDMLKKLHRVLQKQNNLLDFFGIGVRVVKGEVVINRAAQYKILVAMAEFVKKEVELLEIESQKVQEVSEEIRRLFCF